MQQDNPLELVPLGPTDIQISRLGTGAWAWGDSMFWQYGKAGYDEADIHAAYQASLAHGINFFDTAEAYGFGRSEEFLGRFYREAGWPAVIASKFLPFPWRLTSRSLLRALRSSLRRLGLRQVDLYQIHFPLPPVSVESRMDALADAVDAGLTRAVGVSNYSEEQMRRAHAALARRGVPQASNQVEYSLLERQPETNGLLAACRELNVTLIAYSPLAQGLLTGKYTPDNPPSGPRGRRYGRERLAKIQPLLGLMKEIGQGHGGKTPAQVALNWTMAKGTVPIPGAKNGRQAMDNAAAMGWRLSDDEMAALDAASSRIGP